MWMDIMYPCTYQTTGVLFICLHAQSLKEENAQNDCRNKKNGTRMDEQIEKIAKKIWFEINK